MRVACLTSHSWLFAGLLLAAGTLCGCAAETPEYLEVRRIDEDLSPEEVQTFIRIVNQLPGNRLPDLPRLFQPPPQWKASRTLSIGELLQEQQVQLDQKWEVASLASRLKQDRQLHRVLKRGRMTAEQFMGLTLSVGMALSAGTLREEQDLKQLIARGEAVLSELRSDERPFSTVDEETRFHVLQEAVWLCRLQRANQLNLVPEENIQLVSSQQEVLAPMFPEEFRHNPLDAIADVLGSKGLPFEELPASGFDDQISWNPDQALVGHGRTGPAEASPSPAEESDLDGKDAAPAEVSRATSDKSTAQTPQRQPVEAPRPATASAQARRPSSS